MQFLLRRRLFSTAVSVFPGAPPAVPPAARRHHWTLEETHRLRQLVSNYFCPRGNGSTSSSEETTATVGLVNWVAVANCIPGRTRKDCYRKWYYTLHPRIRRGRWTAEEDQLLRIYVNASGSESRWTNIAQWMANGRTPGQCRSRWINVLRRNAYAIHGRSSNGVGAPSPQSSTQEESPSLRIGRWSREEDERLCEGMKEMPRQWHRIARLVVRTRTGHQCAHRWTNMHRIRNSGSGRAIEHVINME